jgi:hypothetical protein
MKRNALIKRAFITLLGGMVISISLAYANCNYGRQYFQCRSASSHVVYGGGFLCPLPSDYVDYHTPAAFAVSCLSSASHLNAKNREQADVACSYTTYAYDNCTGNSWQIDGLITVGAMKCKGDCG